MPLIPTDHETAIDKIQLAQADLDAEYGKGFAESHETIWAALATAYVATDLTRFLAQAIVSQH